MHADGKSTAWLLLTIFVTWTEFNHVLVHVVFVASFSWFIWIWGLRTHDLASKAEAPTRVGKLPLAAGVAGLVFTLGVLVIVPLRPVPPHVTCQRMLEADEDSRATFFTEELRSCLPFLNWIAEKSQHEADLPVAYVDRRPESSLLQRPGVCAVEFNLGWTGLTKEMTCEGFFVLVRDGNQWRVEDMQFTQINGESGSGGILDDVASIRA